MSHSYFINIAVSQEFRDSARSGWSSRSSNSRLSAEDASSRNCLPRSAIHVVSSACRSASVAGTQVHSPTYCRLPLEAKANAVVCSGISVRASLTDSKYGSLKTTNSRSYPWFSISLKLCGMPFSWPTASIVSLFVRLSISSCTRYAAVCFT